MIDRFLKKVFAFSRAIAALIVFLCVLIVVGGIAYFLVSGSKGVSTPDFDEVIETEKMILELGRKVDKENYKEISERRAVETKYGDKIQTIVIEYGLDQAAYDIYVRQLLALDEEYRKQFIKGLKRFMRDGNSYIKKQGDKTDMDIADVANQLQTAGQTADAALAQALLPDLQLTYQELMVALKDDSLAFPIASLP